MRKVMFSAAANTAKYKFDKKTIVYTLTDKLELPITEIVESSHVKRGAHKHYALRCAVLSPDGPSGSFKPMDDQAKAIGQALLETIEDDADILVHCTHGEIRSPAIAFGIAAGLNLDGLWKISDKGIPESFSFKRSSTFQGRTYMRIVRILEEGKEGNQ